MSANSRPSGWDATFAAQVWGRWPHEGLVRAFCHAVRGRKALRVLDVGCGPGANLNFLELEGHQAYGVDTSTVALEQARERLAHAGLPQRLQAGNATALPFPDGFFDAVTEVEVFTYCGEDIGRAWQEAARVLAPGGLVVAVDFGRGCAEPLLSERLHNPRLHTAEEIGAMAAGAGLQVLDQQVHGHTEGPDHLPVEEIVSVARRG